MKIFEMLFSRKPNAIDAEVEDRLETLMELNGGKIYYRLSDALYICSGGFTIRYSRKYHTAYVYDKLCKCFMDENGYVGSVTFGELRSGKDCETTDVVGSRVIYGVSTGCDYDKLYKLMDILRGIRHSVPSNLKEVLK